MEAKITDGQIFRAIDKAGQIAPHGLSPKVIWGLVKQGVAGVQSRHCGAYDLRHTCTRLRNERGRELKQIHLLLAHVSVQTTERYLGCKQWLRDPVINSIGIEPEPPWKSAQKSRSVP
jgi:integrase